MSIGANSVTRNTIIAAITINAILPIPRANQVDDFASYKFKVVLCNRAI
jgi:hypothetical protein